MDPFSVLEEKTPRLTRNVFCVPVNRYSKEKGIIGRGEEDPEASREGEWYLPKTKALAHGSSGSIQEVCTKNKDCDYVMKIIMLNTDIDRKYFLKEVELQKVAFQLGVAPEIIDSWICKDPYIGVIIMPVLQKTLGDVLKDNTVPEEEKKKYIKKAFSILHILHKNNIFHRDSHLANFMVDSNKKLKIIDFGQAQIVYNSSTKFRHSPDFFLPEPPVIPFMDYNILKNGIDKLYVSSEAKAVQAYRKKIENNI